MLTSIWLVYTVYVTGCLQWDNMILSIDLYNLYGCILFQIHWPQALPRGVAFADFKDEHYLGYSEERIADTWKVTCHSVCTQR